MNSIPLSNHSIKHPLNVAAAYLYDSHPNFRVFLGALLIARTIAVILPLWLSTSLAARQGPVPMAGYEISLQVWLTISLLNDALALAGQVCTFTGTGI